MQDQDLKGLPGTNTIPYLPRVSVPKKNVLLILSQGVNVIKHLLSSLMKRPNKLEMFVPAKSFLDLSNVYR
jgi:hypothetical protein